mmetsp:Transcript_58398/g.131562  ORF Transcript_58398/g.131562 Transcript_58398/m.131562 type:complete len:224 (+) Transcript_58398:175-846(+)
MRQPARHPSSGATCTTPSRTQSRQQSAWTSRARRSTWRTAPYGSSSGTPQGRSVSGASSPATSETLRLLSSSTTSRSATPSRARGSGSVTSAPSAAAMPWSPSWGTRLTSQTSGRCRPRRASSRRRSWASRLPRRVQSSATTSCLSSSSWQTPCPPRLRRRRRAAQAVPAVQSPGVQAHRRTQFSSASPLRTRRRRRSATAEITRPVARQARAPRPLLAGAAA